MAKRWIRWTYNPDKDLVGKPEQVDTDVAAMRVADGRAVYCDAPAPVVAPRVAEVTRADVPTKSGKASVRSSAVAE